MDILPTIPRTITGLVGARFSRVTQEEYLEDLEDVNGPVAKILGETRSRAPEGRSTHGHRYGSNTADTWKAATK